MAFQAAARTDVGLIRKENQDNYLILPRQMVYAVADGMGGHAGGREASEITVGALRHALEQTEEIREEDVEAALAAADALIQEEADKNHWEGMGTTLVLAFLSGGQWKVAHIGDSRAYVITPEVIYTLTKDHSLVEELLARGSITEEEAMVHPHRHVLTRALGVNSDPIPEWSRIEAEGAAYLLLCTDGLYNLVEAGRIKDIVLSPALTLDDKAVGLVDEANRNGGSDNITVILIGKENGR